MPAELTLDDLVNEERETTEEGVLIDEDSILLALKHLALAESKIANSN